MTTLERLGEPLEAPGGPRRRRRRPAPAAHPFWRFVFPVLVLVAGVAAALLWRAGTKAVLDSTDGRLVDVVTDPSAPGYEVFVEPTPTLLVVHLDGGALAGVSVLARTDLDAGGAVLLLTPDLLAPVEDGSGRSLTLGAVFEREGIDALSSSVERLVGVGFTETVELDRSGLEALLSLVEPLPYFLADDLVLERGDGSTEIWLARGRYELDGSVAAELYAFRNPGEADANRIERQRRLWESWLTAIDLADDPMAATLPFDEGLSPYLRALGTGTRAVFVPPLDPALVEPDQRPFYVLGDEGAAWMHETIVEMVPLPISPTTIARPSVRLLDGVGDTRLLDAARRDLVEAGAVITAMGNADAFGAGRTVVRVHHLDLLDSARELARAVDATVEIDESPDEPVDVTVVLGSDRR